VLKKVAHVIAAGSLVFAAQAVTADDTQFDIGGGRYQGVAALPLVAAPSATMAGGEAGMPTAGPARLESTHAGAAATQSAPAPYNVPGGYFN
jgi:hypothetical protein